MAGGTSQEGSWSYMTVSEGGFTSTIAFDDVRRVARIANTEVDLQHTNVVLVDSVDSARGPSIASQRWIDPDQEQPLSQPADPITLLIRRTPELLAYLQCDVILPDEMLNAAAQFSCRQLRR